MQYKTKCLPVIIPALCAAVMLAVYCTSVEFDNPLDSKFSYTLTTNAGTGGSVLRNPERTNYAGGTEVTVTAIAEEGYRFTGWSGALTSTSSPVTVIMDGNKSLTASFARAYTLTTDANPTIGGSVTLNPAQTNYIHGTRVSVTAVAAEGYRFTGWSGASTSTSSSVTITMDGDKSLTANFEIAYTLTTNVNPTAGGNVTRNPNQTNYIPGTEVIVTATAATGYIFTGWSGASTSTDSSVTITMDEYKSLTANFERIQMSDFTETVGSVSFDMIAVEGGTFTMGCTPEQGGDCYSGESPAHQVTLTNDFHIGKFEVTQELWRAVMGSNPSYFSGTNLPVETVSWNDIVGTSGASQVINGISYRENGFIYKLNQLTGREYRLPTEAEWEYAARGGNQATATKYAGSNNINDVAWYWSNSSSGTQPVGTKAPNELGLYDMSGNVWEWVSDWYGSYTSSAKTDPTGPVSGLSRVIRGGSWYDGARSARVSNRGISTPSNRDDDIGFRLVVSSP